MSSMQKRFQHCDTFQQRSLRDKTVKTHVREPDWPHTEMRTTSRRLWGGYRILKLDVLSPLPPGSVQSPIAIVASARSISLCPARMFGFFSLCPARMFGFYADITFRRMQGRPFFSYSA